MDPYRKKIIGKDKIEEFYCHGKSVVYVNNRAIEDTFEQACTSALERELKTK